MPSCSICLDELKSPVSLPCGHVFCSECLFRAVNAVRPYTSLHFCPTCRNMYSIVGLNPALVPQQLQRHVSPSVRRIFLEEPSSDTPPKHPNAALTECGRLTAENTALRVHCTLWRKRSEVHAAATLGLLNLARSAKIQADKMKQERDELQRQCHVLKRKLDAEEAFSNSSRPASPAPRYKATSTESINVSDPSSFLSLDQDIAVPSNLHCVQCAERWLGLAVCPHTRPEPQLQSKPLEDGSLPPSLKRRKVEDTDTPRPPQSRGSISHAS
ncbi:hypothetical protein D9758_008033 [Tetrapyrgos nigripes]|uniref:RING-type domain-containing protein n=1 Tax=Tetrapyrgos nigripes TaxID=182062 RepID=A0A8H5FWK0_9AGAR|nr:hypothetical protein D9758_008033 [Tetrapyrgos nigripes]